MTASSDKNKKTKSQTAKPRKKMTVPRFVARKSKGKPLTVLTAYDYPWAKIMDEAGIDAILVGDTVAMVVQGRSTTLPVTIDQMIYHGEMVARAAQHAMVIIDMPFLSYHVSEEQAIENAGRIIKETEAAAVKLEGGANQAKVIRCLTDAEIPVMAHIGMKPQSVRMMGGMSKIQRDVDQLLTDAKAAQDAGAFAIVLELIPQEAAEIITGKLEIPTIGIGAGPKCDGQVLVSHDMLGVQTGFSPKFLKKYANLHATTTDAVRAYIADVQAGTFPDASHSHS